MRFIVLTLYPELFSSFFSVGLIKKAIDEELIEVETINFRKHGIGRHAHVDAPPYGGGAGMLLRPEPIIRTLEDLEAENNQRNLHKILISPRGKPFNQAKAQELSRLPDVLVLICGRFEGFDERIRSFVNEELSIGDFVMMGGEVAAMAIIEAVSRLLPGIIGNKSSLVNESFTNHLLEHAQYTRPYEFRGLKVPDILLSGNHERIRSWHEEDSLKKTQEHRDDLFQKYLHEIKDSGLEKK